MTPRITPRTCCSRRALQQINNQITSLQNQTQMLLNQAKNLTSLPYSSLQAIERSFAHALRLLNEAQHLAYDVNQIDQAFQRLYPQGYTGATSSQQLVSDARRGAGRTRLPPTKMR